ncbi:hypothetical protein [Photobacterium galatheae]|uniref:Uncharacterized protein n=1 Tax=Photobacterium galatheae TaxID=1654360 RepID=A0A066RQA6_9GAMM|nr:hypothetical protein [Photobacterium galatheae]KDM89867.1 hypothetical protein EA58_20670 [Photobacterium galatheae]MCM0151162.1 hypothetical protein [Photobacterium galatheae]
MQPRWLIAQLEEYSFLSQSHRALSDEVRKVLTLTENHGVEHTNRLDSDVYRFTVLYEQLMQAKRERWDSYEHRYKQTAIALEERDQELTEAQTDLERTKEHQSFWQNQLSLARNWKARAQSRVENAKQALRIAEHNRISAESSYHSAKAAYEYARAQKISVYVGKDSDGRDVYESRPNPATAERHAMNSAYSSLQSAISEESLAKSELNAARNEYAQASHQVEGSLTAVADMEVATRHAYSALTNAEDAKTNTLHARYTLDEERRILEEMDDTLKGIENCVSSQQSCQRDLHQQNTKALTTLRHHEQIQDDLVYEIYKIRYALENKVNLLAAFDAPVFLG